MKIASTSTLKLILGVILFPTLFYSCNDSLSKSNSDSTLISTDSPPVQDMEKMETKEMVDELHSISINISNKNYPHENKQRADELKVLLNNRPTVEHDQLWFDYCQQLLQAGDQEACIAELESHFDRNVPLFNQMTPGNLILFELLALAHLRKGEQDNCLSLHTPHSCILPLDEVAYHKLKDGSEMAIRIYQAIYDRNGDPGAKWLINLAYMTLGKHPHAVPIDYFIKFPNWNMEQKNFPHFNQIAKQIGVDIKGLSGGVSLEDFNNDGLLDIFATAYGLDEQVRLMQNTGNGDFRDVTNEAGLEGITSGLNCIHADYNNDGFNDILILRGAWLGATGKHPNSLLKNNGDGTFSDVTVSSGIHSPNPSQTGAFADIDKDGDLDLFIGNEHIGNSYATSEFYLNNGDGTFTEKAKEIGLGDIEGFVKGVTWGDIDNNGWPDLYVSIINGNNLLYKNNEGQFEEITEQAGVGEHESSFNSWFWDVNNDGYDDLFVAGYDINSYHSVAEAFALELQGEASGLSLPVLYINNQDGTFSNETERYGLAKSMFAMGANFGDLDNDGFLDFYIGTGAPNFTAIVPNRMFRNIDGKRFEEVTSSGGFGHIQKGHGVAFGDVDQDGDEDIYAVMGGAFEGDVFTNVFFENPGFGNNWIIVDLEGVTTNKDGIGSRIIVTLDNGTKIYRTVGTGGTFGASSLQQEIGLGSASKIKTLTIEWQNGPVQEFENIPINQKIKFIEGEKEFETVTYEYIPFKGTTSEGA